MLPSAVPSSFSERENLDWLGTSGFAIETIGSPSAFCIFIQQLTFVPVPPDFASNLSRTSIFFRPNSTKTRFPCLSASIPAPAKSRGRLSNIVRASPVVPQVAMTLAQASWGRIAPSVGLFSFFSRASVHVNAKPFSFSPRVGAPLTESE